MVAWVMSQQSHPSPWGVGGKGWGKSNSIGQSWTPAATGKGVGKGFGKGFGKPPAPSWPIPVQKPWLKQNQPYYQAAAPIYNAPRARKPPPSLPASFNVDPNMRYTGTVSFYHKWKGYGFIDLDEKGVVPQDRLFVHWRNVQSDDRFPFLVKGLEVEFGLLKAQDRFNWNITTVRAKFVTLAGGTNIALQDDVDAQEKEFVGGQHLRYTGTLKFFDPRPGFGYVTMDQGYDVDPAVPSDLRIETSEVNSAGKRALPMRNLAVEFGIFKTTKGRYQVYNMTLPGGHPLTQDALENRITMGSQNYQGTVVIWNWRHGWGFIRAEPHSVLPPRVVTKLAQQAQAARARGRRNINDDEKMFYFRKDDCMQGVQPRKDMFCSFQLYIDDKGVGAAEVISLSD